MFELTPPIYGANTTVALTMINTLLCPSESITTPPSFSRAASSAAGYVGQFASTSYAGNFGGPAMLRACSGTIIPVKGNTYLYFYMQVSNETPPLTAGPLTIQTITDGTSTTALFSEHLLAYNNMAPLVGSPVVIGGNQARRGLFPTTVKVVVDRANASAAQAYVAACKALPGGTYPGAQSLFGTQWLMSIEYATANNSYTHVMTPNTISCTGATDASNVVSDPLYGGIGAAITATSNHPGGVNVGFGDGSVKFVNDSVNLQTWWALGTRNGKEIIAGDSY
jgi:prepilin-type processing-associated H-X9-DG protein